MNGRNKAARILVGLGAIGLFATAVFHLKDYPKDTPALSGSNLSAPLQAGFRAIYVLVGWNWIVVAVIALLAAFTEAKLRKVLVLFCGVAVLVETALTLAFMGVFLGTELMGAAALSIISGGLLFRNT
jgi:hypothetical protein